MRCTYILCVTVATCLSWPVVWPAAASADLGDQLFKLLADDGAVDDWFGFSVAISGTTAIVGARMHEHNDTNSGAAYLFDTTTGRQIAEVLPDGGQATFGISVGISGATAIVGEIKGTGSAYLFDATSGTPIAKLLAKDGAAGDTFGHSVGISGATAVVGAYQDDENGDSSGSAYLFDTATGEQIAKLLPDDGAPVDKFGKSVAISGATAIVGAPNDDDNGCQSGSAYLFDATTGRQLFKLLPNDGAATDTFGASVAISGATAIVGAFQADGKATNAGAAYLFDTTTGQQLFKLVADDGEQNDNFGRSVAISGTTAVVGAPLGNNENGSQTGSVYLFDTTTGDQIAKLLPDDGAPLHGFGGSVSISGATAIVGAYGDDDNGTDAGAAYFFDASFCPWDLDDNAVVGASDLLSLLVSWGPCKGCPADFDGNGTVGASDLLALLVNWGPCP